LFFFFFQAEDGIRDLYVTGVQRVLFRSSAAGEALERVRRAGKPVLAFATGYTDDGYQLAAHASEVWLDPLGAVLLTGPGRSQLRSEERRVGKEGRSRGAADH